MTDKFKRCTKCRRWLSRDDYGPKDHTQWPRARCLQCEREREAARYRANPDRRKAQVRAYEAANPEWYREQKQKQAQRAKQRQEGG